MDIVTKERNMFKIYIFVCLVPQLFAEEREDKLAAYLKNKSDYYGTVARPIKDPGDNVTLEFGLRLIHLEVAEATNTLITSVWIRQKWFAHTMTWNALEFNGRERMMIPSAWLWIPRVSLVNTGESEEKDREAKCLLKHTGYIFWLVQRTLRTACLFDVTNYPFDQHTCHLWFQSIEASKHDLDIQLHEESPMDLDTYLQDFKRSDEWEIVANESMRVPSPRELGELLVFSRRTALRFSLTLRRRAGFRAYLLTVPCVVLGAMSILVFALPAERPDRHSLATSLLGSFMFLLLILVNTAPPSAASIPKLGLFYAFNICMIVLSLCLSALVVNVMKRGDKKLPVPRWVEKVFIEQLGRIFLCQQRKKRNRGDPTVYKEVGETPKRVGETPKWKTSNHSSVDSMDNLPPHPCNEDLATLLSSLKSLKSKLASIDKAVHGILKCNKSNSGDSISDIKWKWRLVALVLDRIFMTMYIIIIVISLFVLLPKPNY